MKLVYITIAWSVGILLAASAIPITRTTWLITALSLLIVTWFARRVPGYRLLALVAMVFALGGLRMALFPTTSEIAAFNNSGGLSIEGVIVAPPDYRDDRIQIRVAADRLIRGDDVRETDGLVLVIAPPVTQVSYGDRVFATGRLITPAEYDTFSYADFLARGGVFSIMEQSNVEVLSSGHGSAFFATMFDLRQQAAVYIANFLPEPQAGLMMGILLGDESSIAPEVSDAFSAAGAAHVVAISGFNMVIISSVIMRLLNRITPRRWLAAVIGISAIVIYTLFVGANAAVVRAAVMSILLVIAELLKRKTYVPASLAFVALLMSIANPTVLWDIGFQLSFFATLGLALFVDPIAERFNALLCWLYSRQFADSIGGFLSEPLVVTLASLVTTLPLILVYFNRLSLVVIPVNLLIVPIQALLLFAGALATISAFFIPGLAQLLYWVAWVFLSWTIEIVRLFAALPFAEVEFAIDPRLIALYFIVMMGWAIMHATQPDWWVSLGRFLRRQSIVVATVLSGVIVFALVVSVALSRPDGRFHVWFLDVGHHNAVLMQSPGGAQILVDGGRFPSRLLTAIGDRVPFNDREIELVFITQPDEFEFSALTSVLARYDTGLVLTNGQDNVGEAYAELQATLAGRDVLPVTAGYSIELDDGVMIEVLHPQETPDLADRLDDVLMVLRVTYGDISFLLTSDASQNAQIDMLEAGQWPLASVMQLPQHGTQRALSAGFLAAAQPQAIAAQIDPANRRGDPHGDVLNMLGETPVFRTDEHGTLHFWTDGEFLWLQ